ncbi:TetR/AcrR family transcriptional regulator [Actinoplanes sp. URMC 104]|uniref:TetR/AcrR family transcriptional regulator n=1 Tax=Actinoplanes sp. URMC 104 TaxID=3423409 RepID=UPI003F1A5F4A
MPSTRPERPARIRSTAPERREAVLAAAVRLFSATGYHGTSVGSVASAAGISEGYVFRLFGDKQTLFTAALARCHDRIHSALAAGADEAGAEAPAAGADGAGPRDPAAVLDAMAVAYAKLIAERELLMLQVHALAAADDPSVRAEMLRGHRSLVELVRDRSGAPEEDVQLFFARGQLCHFVTALDLGAGAASGSWARILTNGIRHFGG